MARFRPSRAKRVARAPVPEIDEVIRTLRGERVIIDADLAKIYGVETRTLKQAVRRNREKFPRDFLLELTPTEMLTAQVSARSQDTLSRSQTVILKRGRNVKHRPFAFTEHGAIMAANILNSPQAVQMSVFVIRAFIKMRAMLVDTRDLALKLAALEDELKARLDTHETAIVEVLQRIMALLDPPAPATESSDSSRREMGFHATPPSLANNPT